MTVTALPTPAPSRLTQEAETYVAAVDALHAAFPTLIAEINTHIAALNLNATNDTSASSVAIGTGSKTFTVSASKSFVGGMYLVIADTAAPSTNSMLAQVESYSGTTLVVTSISFSGSGTKTAWKISQSALITPVIGNQEAYVTTDNGMGSVNTKIHRFTTQQSIQGTNITYADSATNGASFTINVTGGYSLVFQSSGSSAQIGWSLNSSQLTTNLGSIAASAILGYADGTGNLSCSVDAYLTAGDVVRPHGNGAAIGISNICWARVRRIF